MIDLAEQVFGALTVREEAPRMGAAGRRAWWCVCECGRRDAVRQSVCAPARRGRADAAKATLPSTESASATGTSSSSSERAATRRARAGAASVIGADGMPSSQHDPLRDGDSHTCGCGPHGHRPGGGPRYQRSGDPYHDDTRRK